MRIEPLCSALGAEVSDIDLSQPLDRETSDALRAAYLEHHLLCFRSDPVTPAEFVRVARIFGEPQRQLIRDEWVDGVEEVSMLNSTYERPEDKPEDMSLVRLTGWHTDDSYFPVPAHSTLLQSIQIPESGDQTSFANTRKAREDMAEDRKAVFDGLMAVHDYDTIRAPGRPTKLTATEDSETAEVIHPLIRTHEDTGAKAIYYNANRTDRVTGMEREESDALLDEIAEQHTRPQYVYRHEWRVGDLLVWDNRCLVHSVNMDFPVQQSRLHQRMLLKGTVPV
ncbi:MAG: TauD/TfdA family dioxygenase [Rhodospirillaceae bacterium]|nr:TauD/TfdA family dioxygenase [Rhodospirillaceae bacterium]